MLTDENAGSQKRIISISESSKDEMFELAKKEFLRENGVLNGDTTRRILPEEIKERYQIHDLIKHIPKELFRLEDY